MRPAPREMSSLSEGWLMNVLFQVNMNAIRDLQSWYRVRYRTWYLLPLLVMLLQDARLLVRVVELLPYGLRNAHLLRELGIVGNSGHHPGLLLRRRGHQTPPFSGAA